MYDSDEVRDAVRQDMWRLVMTPGAATREWLPEERAAAADVLEAQSRQIELALDMNLLKERRIEDELREDAQRIYDELAERLAAGSSRPFGPFSGWARAVGQWLGELFRPLFEALDWLLDDVIFGGWRGL